MTLQYRVTEITAGELFENADLMEKWQTGSITVSDGVMFIKELRRTSAGTYSIGFHDFSPASELLSKLFGVFSTEIRGSRVLYIRELVQE